MIAALYAAIAVVLVLTTTGKAAQSQPLVVTNASPLKFDLDAFDRLKPAARMKIFPGLGHNPFWEDPQAVAVIVNQFLGAHS